jgi:CMP-N-acetylneuraminic acid synthetase
MRESFFGYIPARSGSSRLRDKNFKDFRGGKCLTDLAIETAMNTKEIKYIVLDSDNDEYIKSAALKYPSVIVIRRSDELGRGEVKTSEILKEAINKCKEFLGEQNAVILQPTSPIRKTSELDEAIKKFRNDPTVELVVAATIPVIGYRDLLRLKNGDQVERLFKGRIEEEIYFETGQFYIISQRLLWHSKTPFEVTDKKNLYLTDPFGFIDIDYQYQFRIAQALCDNEFELML